MSGTHARGRYAAHSRPTSREQRAERAAQAAQSVQAEQFLYGEREFVQGHGHGPEPGPGAGHPPEPASSKGFSMPGFLKSGPAKGTDGSNGGTKGSMGGTKGSMGGPKGSKIDFATDLVPSMV